MGEPRPIKHLQGGGEGGKEGGREGGDVPRHAPKTTDGQLVEQFLAQLHVADKEELGVVLEEGEGVIHRADENMFLEDCVHASVRVKEERRKGRREGGREGDSAGQ